MNPAVFSDEQQAVYNTLLNSRESMVITGVAGCGKSTLLQAWMESGHPSAQNVMVMAPTGVAALNVRGSTIHKAFGFHPHMNMEEPRITLRVRSLLHYADTIVIDEVSMVRADLLGAMDLVLKSVRRSKEPFGGIRMIFMGDFWQLPPVVREEEERWMESRHGSRMGWSFFAPCFEALAPKVCFLQHSFRQAGDPAFTDLLNDVRMGRPSVLGTLNEIGSPSRARPGIDFDKIPRLCARKSEVAHYNQQGLTALGNPTVFVDAVITGDASKVPRDAAEGLVLAEGARVMITRNGGNYVNGSLGTLSRFDSETTNWKGELVPAIEVVLDQTGEVARVPRVENEVIGYTVDPETKRPTKDVLATVLQFPLILGYAWTIHKSQGQSLDAAFIDLGRGAFAHGQTYVALSRLRSSAGLFLASPLTRSDLLIDPDVPHFFGESR